jgi:hypothetical protein
MTGLFDLPTPPKFQCRFNCTWDNPSSFISLGFGSTCNNVTLAVLETKVCSNVTTVRGARSETCRMKTPGGLTFNSTIVFTEFQTSVIVGTDSLYEKAQSKFGETKIREVAPEFMRIAVWRGISVFNTDRHIIGEEVTECTLRLAPWRYSNISSTNGNFAAQTEILPAANWMWDTSGRFMSLKLDGLPELAIDAPDLAAISDFFKNEPFTGNITLGNLDGAQYGIRASLYQANITNTMDRVAKAMTDYIRSGPYSQRAVGTTVENVTTVKIQWYWVILPLFVEILAVLLLVLTMLLNGDRTPLWKTSPLALLFTSYRTTDGSLVLEMDHPRQVREASKAMKAKLQ